MTALALEGLAKRFGGRTAVEGLSFEVGAGEVFGLLGPNGAGKTTTVRMLTGLLKPTSGVARVLGLDVATQGEVVRKRVGLLTEQPGVYDRLSARDNLRFFMKLNELDEKKAWPVAEHYLRRFGLWGREAEPAGTFSKGMRQKLALVRTLLHSPELLLDEPTSGLDPESARTVRVLVEELGQSGRTVVLCSHNLSEVERLCGRVAVIRGRLLAISSVKEMRREGLSLVVTLEKDAQGALGLLGALPFAPKGSAEGRLLTVYLDNEEQAPEVVSALVRGGQRVYSAQRGLRSLEEVYLELMREEGS